MEQNFRKRMNLIEHKEHKVRNSGVELLKCFAVILIIFSHSLPKYGGGIGYFDLTKATRSIQVFVLILMNYFGQLGNCLFIVCSSFFLLDENCLKRNKVICIIGDSIAISITFVIVFKLLGAEIQSMEVLECIFPITFEHNWFVGCYLLLYIIHPILNECINALEQKQMIKITTFIIGVWCCAQSILIDKYYYNELIGFISIYFIVGYMKKYIRNTSTSIKPNILICLVSISLFLCLVALTNLLGLKLDFFSNKIFYWKQFINPLLVMFSVALFNIFNIKKFVNLSINYLSSLSLLIYLIHANYIFTIYGKTSIWDMIFKVFSYKFILMWVILLGICSLIGSILIAILYRNTLQKIIYFICDRISLKLFDLEEIFIDKLLNIH